LNNHAQALLLLALLFAGLTIEQTVSGQTITYAENAEIPITDVGDSYYGGGGALLCRTDRIYCCGYSYGEQRQGEWFYPNGTRVKIAASGDDFYRNRGTSVVRLNKRNNATQPTGLYCCEVGTITNPNATICVTLSKCVNQSPVTVFIGKENVTALVGELK
jgi:hypothetical protein